jgi:predicted Zn-dependent protease
MFVNYQTTREQAAWLAPWAHQQGVPVRSTGCAMAPSAQEVTMQHTPNLVLHPGKGTADIETLVQDMDHGMLVDWVNLQMDWQCLDGYCTAIGATEIRNGKRVAQLKGAALLFRADQFWKGVQALGGPASAAYLGGLMSGKGEPPQYTEYSIGVVPARIKQLHPGPVACLVTGRTTTLFIGSDISGALQSAPRRRQMAEQHAAVSLECVAQRRAVGAESHNASRRLAQYQRRCAVR